MRSSRTFTFRYVVANSDVLIWLAFIIQEGHDGCVNPINCSVLGTISDLAFPNLSTRYRRPQISDELFRVVAGVDYSVGPGRSTLLGNILRCRKIGRWRK